MKKKLMVLVLTLAALIGASATSKAQGSSAQENAGNYWVVRHYHYWYRTYSPVYVYRPSYVVVQPAYRFHIYHYYWWRY
jgi:hypothetical protein